MWRRNGRAWIPSSPASPSLFPLPVSISPSPDVVSHWQTPTVAGLRHDRLPCRDPLPPLPLYLCLPFSLSICHMHEGIVNSALHLGFCPFILPIFFMLCRLSPARFSWILRAVRQCGSAVTIVDYEFYSLLSNGN